MSSPRMAAVTPRAVSHSFRLIAPNVDIGQIAPMFRMHGADLHVMQTHAGFWQVRLKQLAVSLGPFCRLQHCRVECAVTTSSRDVQDVCQSE